MAELEEAVVVPDVKGIREQAEKLGYIVKQKGGSKASSPGSTVCHELISPGDPWHITSKSGEVGSRRRFWSRTFATEEEAVLACQKFCATMHVTCAG